jgi:hypothetical protein
VEPGGVRLSGIFQNLILIPGGRRGLREVPGLGFAGIGDKEQGIDDPAFPDSRFRGSGRGGRLAGDPAAFSVQSPGAGRNLVGGIFGRGVKRGDFRPGVFRRDVFRRLAFFSGVLDLVLRGFPGISVLLFIIRSGLFFQRGVFRTFRRAVPEGAGNLRCGLRLRRLFHFREGGILFRRHLRILCFCCFWYFCCFCRFFRSVLYGNYRDSLLGQGLFVIKRFGLRQG